MYAGGFAWSMQGIAPHAVEQVTRLLPQVLISKLPAAKEAFEERCKRVWGTYTVSESTTSVPEGYAS